MDFIDHLKSSVDIVRVVGEYVRLKKNGPRWVGLCPFHTERTPSFGVHTGYQIYKCFGCGAAGDVIKFVQEIEGLTFWEAVKQLAERHGIPLPKRSEQSDEETKLRAALYEMHEIAFRHFQEQLRASAGAEARAYLARRGVSEALIEEFGLGFAERSGQPLTRKLQQEGFGREHLEKSGLAVARQDGSGFFDRFRGRLMFPIQNETGKTIAFAGRLLMDADNEPKYLNSPETEIYRKSWVLYNLHRARKAAREKGHLILVEGYMDVIGLYGAGVRNVVASCGTALTYQQVRSMKRHAEDVVVNFDPDTAGANAAERSINMLLEEGLHIRVLELGGGMDPDEFVKEHGPGAYQTALEAAPRYFEWLASRTRRKFDMRTAEGRVKGLELLIPAIQRIPGKIERAAVVDEVAAYLGVDSGLVVEQFRKIAVERTARAARLKAPPVPHDERILVRCLLDSEEARREALPRLNEIPVEIPLRTAKILAAIAAAGEPFRFGAVEGRLEEEDRALLMNLAFSNDGEEETDISARQALACIERIRAASQSRRYAELKARIKTEQREGRIEEALRLARELERMKKTWRAPAVTGASGTGNLE
jgi:DNA primase